MTKPIDSIECTATEAAAVRAAIARTADAFERRIANEVFAVAGRASIAGGNVEVEIADQHGRRICTITQG